MEKTKNKGPAQSHRTGCVNPLRANLPDPRTNPPVHTARGQNWSSVPDQSFINPYNFVSFEKEMPTRTAPIDGPLTGWLACRLETKTPLIILDTGHAAMAAGDTPKHKEYQAFQLPDADGKPRPAIPGSALRGMIRSLYEAASNSCIGVDMRKDITLSKRLPVTGALKDRGLLYYDTAARTWVLYRAEFSKAKGAKFCGDVPHAGQIFVGGNYYSAGQQVRFNIDTTGNAEIGKGNRTGWLQFMPPINRKKFSPKVLWHAADVPPVNTWPAGDNAPAEQLDKVLSLYLENACASTGRNTIRDPYQKLQAALDLASTQGGYVPVWYLVSDQVRDKRIYLSCSSAGRILMQNQMENLLGERRVCADTSNLCPACALFGTASGDASYGGHLRFTDALADASDVVLPLRALPELSAPKPSAMDFYTEKPTIDAPRKWKYWNYDFAAYPTCGGRGVADRLKPLSAEKIVLAGRKFYWHHTPVAPRAEDEKNPRSCSVRPVKEGTGFSFRIYFERITKAQLGQLLWACTLGENVADSPFQQKLGYAKPLGYGSVKVTVKSTVTRGFSLDSGYTLQETPIAAAIPCPFAKTQSLQELLALCDTNTTKGRMVCYPLGEDCTDPGKANANAGHQWFKGNDALNENRYVLPRATQKGYALTLPKLKKSDMQSFKQHCPNRSGNQNRAGTSAGTRSAWQDGYSSKRNK